MSVAITWLVLVSAAYPLARSWLANRNTSLRYTQGWIALAWAGWLAASLPIETADAARLRYVALSLTGAAAVAVLGARRPGAEAWTFVVLGLLAVLALPLLTSLAAGQPVFLDVPFRVLLAGTLAIGVLNYLPTRLWPAATLLGMGAAGEAYALGANASFLEDGRAQAARLLVALVPWAVYAAVVWRSHARTTFDERWLDFRDRYGMLWAQRVREQFNRAAQNAGWAVALRWNGIETAPGMGPTSEEALELLGAVLKRFGIGQDAKAACAAPVEERVPD